MEAREPPVSMAGPRRAGKENVHTAASATPTGRPGLVCTAPISSWSSRSSRPSLSSAAMYGALHDPGRRAGRWGRACLAPRRQPALLSLVHQPAAFSPSALQGHTHPAARGHPPEAIVLQHELPRPLRKHRAPGLATKLAASGAQRARARAGSQPEKAVDHEEACQCHKAAPRRGGLWRKGEGRAQGSQVGPSGASQCSSPRSPAAPAYLLRAQRAGRRGAGRIRCHHVPSQRLAGCKVRPAHSEAAEEARADLAVLAAVGLQVPATPAPKYSAFSRSAAFPKGFAHLPTSSTSGGSGAAAPSSCRRRYGALYPACRQGCATSGGPFPSPSRRSPPACSERCTPSCSCCCSSLPAESARRRRSAAGACSSARCRRSPAEAVCAVPAATPLSDADAATPACSAAVKLPLLSLPESAAAAAAPARCCCCCRAMSSGLLPAAPLPLGAARRSWRASSRATERSKASFRPYPWCTWAYRRWLAPSTVALTGGAGGGGSGVWLLQC